MKKGIKCIAVIVALGCCMTSLFACGKNQNTSLLTPSGVVPSMQKSGDSLQFYASDEGFAAFLNDYYSRHIRENNGKAIGNVKLGQGWMYQKEWESKYLSWFDSTAKGIKGYDALYNMASGLDAVYVSDEGCVAVQPNMPYLKGTQTNGASLGWTFIYGTQTGNYTADFLDDYADWTINGEKESGTFDKNGFMDYTFNGYRDESLIYEVTGLKESIEYAPMIEIGFKFKDLSMGGSYDANIGDIKVSFRMEGGEWVELSYYEDAIYNPIINGNDMMRSWFPVYLHPEWKGTLEGLRVEIQPKENKNLHLISSVNYIRLETDTRVTNSNTWYLTAMEEYISFTGDREMLERNLQDMRKAMMFQIYALDGKSGLLKTDYIQGKTTTLVPKNKFGQQGNGWYDVISTGTINFQANMCFYQSLLAMAQLEEYAAAYGIQTGDTYIRNPYPFYDGAEDIVWAYTPETLRALAQTVKSNVQKDVSDGGLWNPETGRFAWAIYDADSEGGAEGTAFDYGYTEFNMAAVMLDIASEAQKQSIMSWLDGKRIVDGDDSTGEDIYFYRYGPRINTKTNLKDHISVYQTKAFGTDVQNGGASIHLSYYDLLARDEYYGADNSFQRFKEIQKWYEEVQEAEGKGAAFYRQYYSELLVRYGNAYKMTGGGQIGPIGLDEEFYEAALLYAVVPYTYFGLDALSIDTLKVEPDLPKQLNYMAIENLMFHNIRYDLYITQDSALISNIRGKVNGEKVLLVFDATGKNKVYINYKKTTDFVKQDGKIVVEVPFGHNIVEVK